MRGNAGALCSRWRRRRGGRASGRACGGMSIQATMFTLNMIDSHSVHDGGDSGEVVPAAVHLLRPHLHLRAAAVGVWVVHMVERERSCGKMTRSGRNTRSVANRMTYDPPSAAAAVGVRVVHKIERKGACTCQQHPQEFRRLAGGQLARNDCDSAM